MKCPTSVSSMLKVPSADYILITGFKGSLEAVEELHRRKYAELLERYKIKEGTCAAALLGEIVSFTPFEGDVDELLPYSSFLRNKKFESWSKSTVRRNIRRLTDLGVVQLRYWDDIEEDRREFILEFEDTFLKKTGISLREVLRKVYSKVVVPMERLSGEEFDELDKFSDDLIFIPRLFGTMYGANEEDVASIDDDQIIWKEDVRALSLEEKATKLMKLYRKFVKPRRLIENGKYNNEKSVHDYEERRRVASEYAEALQNMPHIKDVYITGSLSIGDDEERSDIDLLLCRYNCPSKERCLETLPQSNIFVDIFCFSPEEIEELRQEGALVTSFSTPYNQWRENVIEKRYLS